MDSGSSPYTSFTLKVDTQITPGWEKTLGKVLEKIPGVTLSIDANYGLAHVAGYIDAVTTLKLLKKAGKHAQVYSIDSGTKNTVFENRDHYYHHYYNDPQGRYYDYDHYNYYHHHYHHQFYGHPAPHALPPQYLPPIQPPPTAPYYHEPQCTIM